MEETDALMGRPMQSTLDYRAFPSHHHNVEGEAGPVQQNKRVIAVLGGVTLVCVVSLIVVFVSASKSGGGGGGGSSTPAPILSFVHVTDMHLWEVQDSGVTKVCENGVVGFEGPFGSYGCDLNAKLMQSALSAAKQQAAAVSTVPPSFVVASGDFAMHKSPSHNETVKHVRAMFEEVAGAFPNMLVIPTIGNNDVYPDNMAPLPEEILNTTGTNMYRDLFDIWEDHILCKPCGSVSNPIDHSANKGTFLRGGYFVLKPRDGLRIVSLNSLVFTHKYWEDWKKINATYLPVADPNGQLKWFRAQLDAAKNAGDAVLVITHVPVGYELVYMATFTGVSDYYEDAYLETFLQTLTDYTDLLAGLLFGHTHFDDFRVLFANQSASAATSPLDPVEQTPIAAGLIAPSISPIFVNNPGFRITYMANRGNGMHISDYDQYYTDLLSTNIADSATWTREYRFSEEYSQYGVHSTFPEDLQRLANAMKTDGTAFSRYSSHRILQYSPYRYKLNCMLLHSGPAAFNACVTDAPVGA